MLCYEEESLQSVWRSYMSEISELRILHVLALYGDNFTDRYVMYYRVNRSEQEVYLVDQQIVSRKMNLCFINQNCKPV